MFSFYIIIANLKIRNYFDLTFVLPLSVCSGMPSLNNK